MVMTFVMKRAGRHKAMNAPEPPSSNGLRYLAVGVLGIAVLLGFYFIQLNAKVDRQREEAAERLTLCRHLEAVVGATASSREALQETCKQLSEQLLESATPD
ncbi:hypothetical protein PFLmoz3_04426 [Pseudomonas fluorescens]|uniref:Uncharacterized protein n=4 Tax=Pseudomonas TaxID=286 RepID=A0A120G6L7_PSEFL|nr:hypothetical protein PFLmoz3_04426 [Pseudomonas fluorescens]